MGLITKPIWRIDQEKKKMETPGGYGSPNSGRD